MFHNWRHHIFTDSSTKIGFQEQKKEIYFFQSKWQNPCDHAQSTAHPLSFKNIYVKDQHKFTLYTKSWPHLSWFHSFDAELSKCSIEFRYIMNDKNNCRMNYIQSDCGYYQSKIWKYGINFQKIANWKNFAFDTEILICITKVWQGCI